MSSSLMGFSHFIWIIPLINLAAYLLIRFAASKSHKTAAAAAYLSAAASLAAGILIFSERFVIEMPVMEAPWLQLLGAEETSLSCGVISDSLTAVFLMLVPLCILSLAMYAPSYFKQAYSKAASKKERKAEALWQKESADYLSFLMIWLLSSVLFVLSNNIWQSLIFIQAAFLASFKMLRRSPSALYWSGAAVSAAGSALIHFSLSPYFTSLASLTQLHKVTAGAASGAVSAAVGLGLQYFCLIKAKPEIKLHEAELPNIPAAASSILNGILPLYFMSRIFSLFSSADSLSSAGMLSAAAAIAASLIYALSAAAQSSLTRIISLITASQAALSASFLAMGAIKDADFYIISVSISSLIIFMASGQAVLTAESDDLQKIKKTQQGMFYTWTAFLFGALSSAGIPPLAGFFSAGGLQHFSLFSSALGKVLFILTCAQEITAAYALFKIYIYAFKDTQERESEETLKNFGTPLWALPLMLSSFTLTLGLTNIHYSFGLPIPQLYDDFMLCHQAASSGSAWISSSINTACILSALLYYSKIEQKDTERFFSLYSALSRRLAFMLPEFKETAE